MSSVADIELLKKKHAQLEKKIKEVSSYPYRNMGLIAELKKLKLSIKDSIAAENWTESQYSRTCAIVFNCVL